MEFRMRNIPGQLWKNFKILCLEQDVTITAKLLELIKKELAEKGRPR